MDRYKYKNTSTNEEIDLEYLFSPSNGSFPLGYLPNFKYKDGTMAKGVIKTDNWQEDALVSDFGYTDLYNPNAIFVKNGYWPIFNSWTDQYDPGAYTLKIEENELCLYKGKEVIKSSIASNFNGEILPSRMFLILQAGGGGGGGTNNIYAGGNNIGGANGGAGGSGACCAVCLNLDYLKSSSNNYFTIVIGKGGTGASNGDLDINAYPGLAAEGAFTGKAGNAGEASSVWFNGTKLFEVTGGGAGKSTTGYGAGSPGSGGIFNVITGQDIYWWPAPCLFDGTFSSSCWLNGASGGTYKHSGGDTASVDIKATSNSNYYSKYRMYIKIGSKKGGKAGNGESPGGGASYFASGGDGGSTAEKGKNGSKGSGGGGGRWTATGVGSIINLSAIYAACKGGGNGGNGLFTLYY